MDMTFSTRNVRSLYTAGSLMTLAEEISEYVRLGGGYRRLDGTKVALKQKANIQGVSGS
jgi:hypothetical protein